jgi:hypothetical protein
VNDRTRVQDPGPGSAAHQTSADAAIVTTAPGRKPKITVQDLLEQYGDPPEDFDPPAELSGRYSPRNLWLIDCQRPGATRLHAFRGWLQHGRRVRHGEKAIRIIVPHTGYVLDPDVADAEIPVIKRFRVACLFDIGQTDPIEYAAADSDAGR